MKKAIYFLTVALVSMLAMSCGKFSDGTSVWQGGLWIIPWVIGAGAGICWFLTIKSWLAGGTQGWVKKDEYRSEYTTDDKKFPIWEASFFWFSVALTVADIIVIILVNGDK
jgi:hypothetical protein